MEIPENVNFILNTLELFGFEAYIVGGCVRDSIMGVKPKDWDITTSAEPQDIKKCFNKTYDTGIKHGTITVVIDDEKYEVTTLRIDGEYIDNRRPENVIFSDNIREDLQRRDFTVNAIAYNKYSGYIDPFDGIIDIKLGVIKGVGRPDERFKEDALRMLRAVRFSAKLGFNIEEETSDAIIRNAHLIKNISGERIREELFGILVSSNPSVVLMKEFIAIWKVLFKPLSRSILENGNYIGKLLEVCKPNIYARIQTLIFFLNEDEAEQFLHKLKLSNQMYRRLKNVHSVLRKYTGSDYYSVAQKINEIGFEAFEDYLYMLMLDCIANDKDIERTSRLDDYYRQICDENLPIFIKDLAINGYDISNEFKVTGMLIGKTLVKLLDFVHKNPQKNNYRDLIEASYIIITKEL